MLSARASVEFTAEGFYLDSAGPSQSQVSLAHALILEQLVAGPGEDDAPRLQNEAPVRDPKRVLRVLLHEQHRDSLAVDLLHDPEHLLHQQRCQPEPPLARHQKPWAPPPTPAA